MGALRDIVVSSDEMRARCLLERQKESKKETLQPDEMSSGCNVSFLVSQNMFLAKGAAKFLVTGGFNKVLTSIIFLSVC